MYVLYLVGQITANPLTYEWRGRVEEYFKGNEYIRTINPCSCTFNQTALESDDQIENGFSKKAFKEKGIVLLPHRDKEYVRQSNIAFANLNMYSPEKPILGSFFELAWYFNAPEKMVIGIFNGDPTKDFQCNHPFVRETVCAWVKDEIKACQLLERFIDIK
jgi:hypothetical protein